MLLLIAIGIAFTSCELQFEDNRRLLIEGDVATSIDHDKSSIPIDVYVADGVVFSFFLIVPLFREETELIGTGMMDEEGRFAITTIAPQDPDNIFVLINDTESSNHQQNFSTLLIENINSLEENESSYTLPRLTLEPIHQAQFNIVREQNVLDTIAYTISYPTGVKVMDFKSGMETTQESNFKSDLLLPSEMTKSFAFDIPDNNKVIVVYSLINNGNVTENEVELSINLENNTYELRL